MNNMKKPKIRFKGFTDDWEQCKLSEVVTEIKRTDEKSDAPVMMITAENGFINQSERYSTNNAGQSLKKYILLEKGELAYNHGASKLRPYGSCFALTTEEKARIPFVYHCFSTETENSEFLSIVLNGKAVEKQLRRIVSSGARMDGLLNISFDEYTSIPVMLPRKDEQDRIAEYFKNLDHLITLHQRKYEKLQIIKKSMLENCFPKNGEKVPKIRFSGFTGDWEQRKLEDYIIEYHEVTTENNQYPALTSSRKGIFLQTEYFAGNQIASDDNTGYNIVPYGYFTYRHMSDDEIFHFNINDIVENGIVSTLYPVFTTNDKLDSRYLQYQLNYGYEFARFAVLQKQGGSRTYMYLSKLKQLSLTMPKDIEEQKKISGFFMELDNLITLHQSELEKLQKIKKSLLERMFV